jgi:hypothetical protein
MRILTLISVIILSFFSANALAYGSSSGGQKACSKPQLTDFTPPHLAEVAPLTTFSFNASASTEPSSIQVTVKKLSVEVATKKTTSGYHITGTLPAALKSTYARINITARSANRCEGSDGWLLKIKD